MRRKVSKPIRCVETGEIFQSITEAARSVDVSESAIGHVVTGKREKSGGFHWEYYHENEGSIDPTNHFEQVVLSL